MGKYHPAFADSHSDSIPFSNCDTDFFSVANRIDDAVRLANINININICISNSQPGWSGSWRTGKPDAYANNVASCFSEALRNRTPVDLNREASSFFAGRS